MNCAPTTHAQAASADDASNLLAEINSAWVTQVIRTACELQLPDHLARGAMETSSLAIATGCDTDSLRRLLLAMTALDLCVSPDARSWRLSSRGKLLCREGPRSLHHWALHSGGGLWQRLGELTESVRSGSSWSERKHGVGGYERLASDAKAEDVFHKAMVELTRHTLSMVVPLLEIHAVGRVVDVGGGRGELLGAVLVKKPNAHGVLLDQAVALEGAHELLDDLGVAARCQLEAGSFFTAVPSGGDLYMLKSVLHNWDDSSCRRILSRCSEALSQGGTLAVIERPRPAFPGHGTRDREVARTDLNMLVSLTGRERSVEDYAKLFDDAGLCITAVRATESEWSVIEARRRKLD